MAKQDSSLIKGENIEGIQVKIPNTDTSNSSDPTGSKFGYINATISVPLSLCKSVSTAEDGNFQPDSNNFADCDNFMASYCHNTSAMAHCT